jgi:hypothetical protein
MTSLESVPVSLRLAKTTAELTERQNMTVHVMASIRGVAESERDRAAISALTLLHTLAGELGTYPTRFSVIFDGLPWPFAYPSSTGSDPLSWDDVPVTATLPFLAVVTPQRVLVSMNGDEIQKTRWLQRILEDLP